MELFGFLVVSKHMSVLLRTGFLSWEQGTHLGGTHAGDVPVDLQALHQALQHLVEVARYHSQVDQRPARRVRRGRILRVR